MHDSSETLITPSTAIVPPGQSAVTSIYRIKVSGQPHLVTITWCKNLLLHGLSVTIDRDFKLDLKPWYFWRKTGSKNITVDDGTNIHLFWDLRDAVFDSETEPRSGFYVAVVSGDEVVLLEGDMKKDAYRRTRCRPSLKEPTLVSRTEHVFIKRRFSTAVRVKNGKVHRVAVGCKFGENDHSMEIWIDGCRAFQVEHLQWKFRGNHECTRNVVSGTGGGTRLDVCWDVHDWMFGSSPRHGVFIFRAISDQAEEPPWGVADDVASGFCLFVHAWRID